MEQSHDRWAPVADKPYHWVFTGKNGPEKQGTVKKFVNWEETGSMYGEKLLICSNLDLEQQKQKEQNQGDTTPLQTRAPALMETKHDVGN